MLKKDFEKMRRIDVNIVLCDDNTVFLKNLHYMIQNVVAQYDWICTYQYFSDAATLLEADLEKADILFLDIDMPGMDGITAGKLLRDRYSELIIVYVTGYVQYARDGYSVAAFRYLLKDSLNTELPDCIRDIQEKLYAQQESITIRGLENLFQIRMQDILYLEGTSQRHVIVHRRQGELECMGTLTNYEKLLELHGFLRIQRSYLVNMFHVQWIKNYYVHLSNGEMLKVSERKYPNATLRYLMWKGHKL